MTKIASVQPRFVAAMTVYYDQKAKDNPYRVYVEGTVWHWIDVQQGSGVWKPFRTLHQKYADLASAMNALYQYALNHNEEGR